MARTPDPRVAQMRKRAVVLERKGLNGRQIAERLGRPESTVGKWLRAERGTNRYKETVVKLLYQGCSFEEIIEDVGCGEATVRKIEREIRSTLEADYTKARKRLSYFLANHELEKKAKYTLYDSFGNDLVSHCNWLVDTDPKSAKEPIDIAIGQFEYLRKVFRLPEKIQKATCNLVQATAADAGRERALGQPEVGLDILERVQKTYPGCEACNADVARREAVLLVASGQQEEPRKSTRWYRKALVRIEEATRIYRAMGHDGHDGHSNGLGSCALVETSIHYVLMKPRKAVAVAEEALRSYVTPLHGVLFTGLRFQKALALISFKTPHSHRMAERIASQLYSECAPSSSVGRMRVAWLAGRSAARIGEEGTAKLRLEDALQDAEALELAHTAVAILADIEGLAPDPKSLKARVERLKVHGENDKFPPWLRTVEALLRTATNEAEEDILTALCRLWKASGGDKIYPGQSYPLLVKMMPVPT